MTMRLTPELTCGFEEIDGQHRTLLQRVDAAVQAAKSDDLPATRSALSALGDYLASHFTAEESLMSANTYPERSRHKSAHDLFMQDFAQLQREVESTGLALPNVLWISTRMPEWVKFHIQVNDIPLGRYLAVQRTRGDQLVGRVAKPPGA
ncbi:MAG TPA: hemerythrin family protein [Anaeromyxobacteraceae bacterium]|nr:hemerythrin family protein [Anaeromyxobacteraceae bacterium]